MSDCIGWQALTQSQTHTPTHRPTPRQTGTGTPSLTQKHSHRATHRKTHKHTHTITHSQTKSHKNSQTHIHSHSHSHLHPNTYWDSSDWLEPLRINLILSKSLSCYSIYKLRHVAKKNVKMVWHVACDIPGELLWHFGLSMTFRES